MYCDWAKTNKLMQDYHDKEWGVFILEDNKHFELLSLESLQCGLSWNIILQKRETLRKCFDNFNYLKIKDYTEKDILNIYNTANTLKSLPKIKAIINNASCFNNIVKEYGSFINYLATFTNNQLYIYPSHSNNVPSSNSLSEAIAKDLKSRGFKYVGAITIYSYLQACGIINDHSKECACFKRLLEKYTYVYKDD